MALTLPPLPIDACLPELRETVAGQNCAVLVAAPGAGKTTRVPLALLDEAWTKGGRIIVLEPRRIAARAAASHMASLLGEQPGETVGYRVRMDSKVSTRTRIEVVTEGVFTRMALEDPELSGIAAVLFDEFHERSLDGDLGLALALDIQGALREDLRILPMSATIDGAKVAGLLGGAPVIESEGRAYPVEIRYARRDPDERAEDSVAAAIRTALREETGSILAFLPGQGEIMRCASRLEDSLPPDTDICPLYGALSPAEQDRAIRPAPEGHRKVVIATSIAETSITIDGVRIVIDSGLARVPRFEPGTGLTRLETIRASRASVDQRAGRAGRTAPGIAIRLWHEGQTSALPDAAAPEILESDLSGLVLDLASWGVTDPATLKWLDLPPGPAWNEAVTLLRSLDCLNEDGTITKEGAAMRAMPLPPRLAHMVLEGARHGAARDAAMLAMLVTERGLGGNVPDLAERLERAGRDQGRRARDVRQAAARQAKQAEKAAMAEKSAGKTSGAMLSAGGLLSLAWPDRIAKRVGQNGQGEALFRLANGRQARMAETSPLGRAEFLVAAEIQGSAGNARILSGAQISAEEIELLHGHHIREERLVEADDSGRLRARKVTRIGTLELSSKPDSITAADDAGTLLIAHIRGGGLEVLDFGHAAEFRHRLGFLHHHLPERFPDVSDEALLGTLETWLGPFIGNATSLAQVTPDKLHDALAFLVGHANAADTDCLAPARFVTPAGSAIRLRYEGEKAILQVRVQEMFGTSVHPAILDGKLPLVVELLSPAGRPVQTTLDLPGFWHGSWRDVRSEMRGRYPKHVWPEDPANAQPTARAKPRGK